MLWRAVLGQAIHDIYSGDERLRRDVLIWMRSPDFITVCDFADVHATSMRQQMAALMKLSRILAQKYGPMLKAKIIE